jgi:SNF2 family DNA or RNA helicase
MPYSKQLAMQLEALFDPVIYQQGKSLQQKNTVSQLQKMPFISAQVKDPELGDCKTFINIIQQGELLQVDGECSCDLEFNCGHVAATLLQYLDASVVVDNTSDISKVIKNKSTDIEFTTQHKLHYVLSLQNQRLVLHLYLVSDKTTTAYTAKLSLNNPPRFVSSIDLQIFQWLDNENRDLSDAGFVLHKNCDVLTNELIQTGRCHWQHVKNPLLRSAVQKNAKWFWQQYTDGSQQLMACMDDKAFTVLPVLPLLYIDQQHNLIGLVSTGLQSEQNKVISELPVYHVAEIHNALSAPPLKDLLDKLPEPRISKSLDKKQTCPRVCLRLSVKGNKTTHKNKNLKGFNLELKLLFQYPGRKIDYNDSSTYVGQFTDNHFIQWQRNSGFELSIKKQLQSFGWSANNDNVWNLSSDLNGWNSACFLAIEILELKKQGWDIQNENCPDVLQIEQLNWIASIEVAKNQRHINFRLQQYNDSEEDINLLEALVKNLKSKWLDRKDLPVKDDSVLMTENRKLIVVPNSLLKPLLNCLLELNSNRSLDKEGGLLLSRGRFQTIYSLLKTLSKTLTIDINISTDLNSDQQTKAVKYNKDDELKGVNAQLRSYQQQGVDWLHALYHKQLGCLLADDMGLGKTLQILVFLWQSKCRGLLEYPVLIIAPTSLLSNWQAEIKKFTPGLNSLVLHGPKRHQSFSHIGEHDLIITSYPLVVRDQQLLLEYPWQILILDEAQAIKNANSLTSKAVSEFEAKINICMSGTPVENHLGELWSIFNFTLPGLLGAKHQFDEWFRDPIEKHNDEVQHELLVERVSPVMLRRSKADVLPQLPEKVHQTIFIKLDEYQQQIYDAIHKQMTESLRDNIRYQGLNASRMHILDALTRLRQICCDPRLLPRVLSAEKISSSKMNHLLKMLDEMLAQGRKILLFSQFTSLLSLLEVELKRKDIKYSLLTGQTKKRAQQIEQFQQGESSLFLISLKAGGSGLNLTQADTVIHYDPWWNPAVENQATDRAHRIGQNKSVMVYKLIAANTIEEKIIKLQKNKQNIADNLLEGTSKKVFDSSDLTGLLQLLEVEI